MVRSVVVAQEPDPLMDLLRIDLLELPFLLLLAVLFVGAMIRANTTYWLGRAAAAGGRRTRWARHLQGPAMARAEAFVAKWGVWAVPLCFLTVGIQTAVNASAGATRMPLRRYLPAVIVGAMLWALLYATVGLAAFSTAMLAFAQSPWGLALLALGVLAVAFFVRRHRRDPARPEREALDRLSGTPVPVPRPRSYGPRADHVFELYGTPGDPMLVFVHGAGFDPAIDRTHARPAAHALAAAGWRVALVEYRRIAGEPDASVDDLRRFDRQVAHALDAAPVLWVGHSAGGTMALLRTMSRDLPVVPVLALAPVADLARQSPVGRTGRAVVAWTGGTPEARPGRYARLDPSVQLLAAPDPAAIRERVTLLHGREDRTVPVEHNAQSPWPCTTLEGAHHVDLVDPGSPHWAAVLEAIRRAVDASPRTG